MNGRVKKIYEIRIGCEVCGTGKPRWTYNSTGLFGLHACYDCYQQRTYAMEREIEEKCASLVTKQCGNDFTYKYCIAFENAKRKYLRLLRENNGVIDPVVRCPRCKIVQSIFEFDKGFFYPLPCRMDNPSGCNRYCYSCQLDIQYLKTPEYRLEKTQEYLSRVKKPTITTALILRGMAITKENEALIEQFILGNRMKKFLRDHNARRQYESDYTDVYGKQQPYEENHEGRVSA